MYFYCDAITKLYYALLEAGGTAIAKLVALQKNEIMHVGLDFG